MARWCKGIRENARLKERHRSAETGSLIRPGKKQVIHHGTDIAGFTSEADSGYSRYDAIHLRYSTTGTQVASGYEAETRTLCLTIMSGDTKRRLIVNGDDFGRSRAVNEAITRTATGGILRSVSVMVNMPYAEEVVHLRRERPNISIGLHLNMTSGKPISRPGLIPSLLGDSGRFMEWQTFVGRLLTGRIQSRDIRREVEAQVNCLCSLIGEVSHFDSHKHIHVFPQVLKPVLWAGKKRGITRIRAIRRYFASCHGAQFPQWLMKARHFMRMPHSLPGQVLRPGQRNLVARHGFHSPDFLLSVFPKISTREVGTASELWRHALKYLPPGTTEVNCHPGRSADEESVFSGARLGEFLKQNSIQIGNYFDI